LVPAGRLAAVGLRALAGYRGTDTKLCNSSLEPNFREGDPGNSVLFVPR